MTKSPGPDDALRLALRQVTKRFRRVLALDGAELAVRPGTVHALLGENGAGKTTLMRVAYGMIRPDAGQVAVDGVARSFRSSADAIRAGVGMVHQHYALVPAMTVAENIALGGRGRYDARATAARVRALADETGLTLDPDARVEHLSVEAQQRVEIVKALAHDARILILDEPTAVLPPATAAGLLAWLRQWAGADRAVVLITHKLREALQVADDVTVLRHGRTALTASARSVSEADLARAMLGAAPLTRGEQATETAAGERTAGGAPAAGGTHPGSGAVITLDGVTVADEQGTARIRDASFTVNAGEIVGIAGVEGQGQHELLRAMAGRRSVVAGRLITSDTIGFIPEDRQRDALILEFSLYENVALRGAGARRGLIAWRAIQDRTRTMLTVYDVRAAGESVPAATLSGGNQQKLVLAREMEDSEQGRTSALVAENPTRGLDIQATAAVHDRLRAARDAGVAIALYSSAIDEVLALADRVLVVARGTVREVPRDRDAVGRAVLGL